MPGTVLQLSPLAADPRVNLDPVRHNDTSSDPPHKTAVLVAPFTYWFLPSSTSIVETDDIDAMAQTLRHRGYEVTELSGGDATVKSIVDALKSSPGVVVFDTHGDTIGDITIGETVTGVGANDSAAFSKAKAYETTRLEREGLTSLVNFRKIGKQPSTFTLSMADCSYLVSFGKSDCQYNVDLTYEFWHWLAQGNSSFARSLVIMDACLTDTTSFLRDAVHAEAYFAFRNSVNVQVGTAVEQYIIDTVARPTHSAEEAFYNLLRVQKTGLMIYKEDALLNNILGAPGTYRSLTGNLDGWAWDSKTLTMVNYRGSGWLNSGVDPGQIWWMLYAGRWDTDAQDGALALKNCFAMYWSKDKPGGLADPFCNAANAGQLSDENRVEYDLNYAIYLLDGEKPAIFPGQVVPRWTLNEGLAS